MRNEVRTVRTSLRLTQQQLADKVGVSRQSIIAIESGRYLPSAALALKLAREMGTTVEGLFILEPGD